MVRASSVRLMWRLAPLALPALGGSPSAAGPAGQCLATASAAEGGGNATTVRELGLNLLHQAVGRRPSAWRETYLAPILASIGADYGELTRLRLQFGTCGADEPGGLPESSSGGSDPGDHVDLIVKRFRAKGEPSPRAGEAIADVASVERARFLRSNHVEASSYANLSSRLAEAGLNFPRMLHLSEAGPGAPVTLLLEDIGARFPRGAMGELRRLSPEEMRAAARWLASFHALFWEDARAEERGLWARGSYWILDELAALELAGLPEAYENRYLSAQEWRRLRGAARAIDTRLRGQRASGLPSPPTPPAAPGRPRFLTLVHGDAKPANILCSGRRGPPEVECAFLDFAWVGEGYGMSDVAYLLWGELAQASVDGYLADYHAALQARLARKDPDAGGGGYTLERMYRHFELCVVDHIRWKVGFRNGAVFWAMPWAIDMLRAVMGRLDGGAVLAEDDYVRAVDREFPLP